MSQNTQFSQNTKSSQWEALFVQACRIIDFVNKDHEILTSWTFGGGTAMMLQINHRESHDVDLFLDDPQLLSYVTAAVGDLQFDLGAPSYNSDGTGHLKIAFSKIGEIDFIVTGHLTAPYFVEREILGRFVKLETIAEIIAKKVRFRGSHILPRDVFDIAAACSAGYENEIKAALDEMPEYKMAAAKYLAKLNPEYVDTIISQLMINGGFETVAKNAVEITSRVLNS